MNSEARHHERPGLRWRLFAAAWILFSAHFATNVVREHYPAFALIERGNLQCDDYAGFHSDLFEHTDGHTYINNNVTASLLAAVPLFVARPLLDRLTEHRLEQRAANPAPPEATYRTKYPMRQEFFRKVRERGLDLRFGAATAVTSALLMAPLSAWMVVLMFGLLRRRGAATRRSVWLALLFGFATPLFFRTAHLNHNLMSMYACFGGFLLLWPQLEAGTPTATRRFLAGTLAGLCMAFDFSGAVGLLFLYGLLLAHESGRGSWWRAIQRGWWFVAGTLPSVLLLMATQWWMFGNPFLPAQFWMEPADFTHHGMQGFSWPSLDLIWFNLAHPGYGLYLFAPLFLLAWVPQRWLASFPGSSADTPAPTPILGTLDRRLITGFLIAFLVFCSANQYARLQWNTGFRYFIVLVPFLFLQCADLLAGMTARRLALLSAPVLLHSWVLCMARDTVPLSWHRLFAVEGIQLPWLTVMHQTSASGMLPGGRWLAPAIVLLCGVVVWLLLRRPDGSGPTVTLTSGPTGDHPSRSGVQA